LIDISDDQLDNQLLELEKLTTINPSTTTDNTKTIPSTSISSDNLVDIDDSLIEHEKMFADLLSPLSSETNNTNNSTDLLGTNDSTSFDADWTAAFGNTSNQQSQSAAIHDNPGASHNNFLPSSLLNELLTSTNKINQSTMPLSSTNAKPKPTTGKTTDKSNWLNLFAELDPIQNPDAIGKSVSDEFDRSC
jgi:hypothetical protein